MPSLQSRSWRIVLRLAVKWPIARADASLDAYLAALRTAFERDERRPRKIPPGIRIVPIDTDGVRGEWIMREELDYGERAVLYVHGGGMVAKSARAYRSITIPLARELGVPIFALDYAHAPENPYPAALEQTVAAYDALRLRIPARGILIVGDSAGGNLALATLLAVRERRGEQRPVAGIVALSPWTDLLSTGASIVANAASDETLSPGSEKFAHADLYAPRARLSEPLVSPLYGDYTDGPPLLVFASSSEILLDDARALVARVRAQGGIATFVAGEKLPHAWPIYDFLPEARIARTTIVAFARRAWRGAGSDCKA